MLEDLIVTAVREAIDKGKADAAKELGKLMPAGLGGPARILVGHERSRHSHRAVDPFRRRDPALSVPRRGQPGAAAGHGTLHTNAGEGAVRPSSLGIAPAPLEFSPDFGCFLRSDEWHQLGLNVIPIQNVLLTEEYTLEVDPILWSRRKRFHDDEVFRGAGPNWRVGRENKFAGSRDGGFLERKRA